jgi:tryptophan-rich sensory protein
MPEPTDQSLALFELYLSTAEKVSDRRAAANAWMLSVNSAIVGLYGYLAADKPSVDADEKKIWLWAIPAAGALVCLAWTALLTSYRQLNAAKFEVLQELEAHFPIPPFTRERIAYKKLDRTPLSTIERLIPLFFVALYILMCLAALTSRHK